MKWKRGLMLFDRIILDAENIDNPKEFVEDLNFLFNKTYDILPTQARYFLKRLG